MKRKYPRYPRSYPSLPGNGNGNVDNYTAVAMSALRRLSPWLRDCLDKARQWDDIVAWAGVAAVEGRKKGWDQRQTYNAAQRYIYRALKASGWVRPRGSRNYLRYEYVFDHTAPEDDSGE